MNAIDKPILPKPEGKEWIRWASEMVQVLTMWFDRLGQNGIPAGTPFPFLGTDVPPGYLEMNGQVVSQRTYLALYYAIGDRYNTGGEGAGNFRLPNAAGMVFMQDNSFALGGSDTASIALANLPNVNLPVTEVGHSHLVQNVLAPSGTTNVGSGSTPITTGTTVNRVSDQATTGLSVRLNGGGTPISLKQKYFGGKWMIKT